MDPLAVLIYLLVPAGWVSAGALVYAASLPPRVGALTERAVIAILIAAFLTSAAFLTLNTETDHALASTEIARVVFRLSALGLGIIPVAWLILWLTGRLGKDD